MNILHGKRMVVVGVGSEMGRVSAMRLAGDGAELLVVDPRQEALDEVREATATQFGRSCKTLKGPHGDEKTIDQVVAWCESSWDRVDGVFVTAATFDWWDSDAVTMATWEQLLRVDLLMPVFYAMRLRPLLERSAAGSVVFYGSIDGSFGNPRVPAYSAARGGLVPSARILAHTMGPANVRVNVIAGAGIRAAGPDAPQVRAPLSDEQDLLSRTDLGRRAEAEEVAALAAFLLGPESSYLTGAVIPLDGGRMTVTAGTETH